MFNVRRPQFSRSLIAAVRYACQPLEARRLLSSFSISGTAGNDVIILRTIGSNYEWSVNGNAVSVPQANVTDFLTRPRGAMTRSRSVTCSPATT